MLQETAEVVLHPAPVGTAAVGGSNSTKAQSYTHSAELEGSHGSEPSPVQETHGGRKVPPSPHKVSFVSKLENKVVRMCKYTHSQAGAQKGGSAEETVPLKFRTVTETRTYKEPSEKGLCPMKPSQKVVVPIVTVETDLEEVASQEVENDRQAESLPNQKDGAGPQSPQTPKRRLTVHSRDILESSSLISLYMESDFRYYFQHPWSRLFCAYLVTFSNFLIYAEDPVAHSYMESSIPMIGNNLAFIFASYPPNAWSLLKVVLWITGIVVGLVVGKLLIHKIIFNKLFRLKMFSDDKGSWMVMFLVTVVSVFIFSEVYNLVLLIGGSAMDCYRITTNMGISNHVFMKVAATGTWLGDFLTAWMVTDMMLQERLYPTWAVRMRKWWNTGYNRIILFWIIVFSSSSIVIFVITTHYVDWDSLNRDILHSNELSRAYLASFILVLDIFVVMQDWDFPHFIGSIDIKLPGVNQAHIRFNIPKLLRKLQYWHVHISGKWFNYGILFLVILLDLNMWKNQIFYDPYTYGQYVDSEGRIHSVLDDYSINNASLSLISFDYRNSTIDPHTGKRYIEEDIVMNSRYHEFTAGLKATAFIPCITVYIFFGIFVWDYGRLPKPTKEDPYAGRLKKRKKAKFSMRIGRKRMRKRFQAPSATLTTFHALILDQQEQEAAVKELTEEVWKSKVEEGKD